MQFRPRASTREEPVSCPHCGYSLEELEPLVIPIGPSGIAGVNAPQAIARAYRRGAAVWIQNGAFATPGAEIKLPGLTEGAYTIAWIENGAVVETVHGRSARRAVPATGYVRAVVTRDDGKKAWVQPARR